MDVGLCRAQKRSEVLIQGRWVRSRTQFDKAMQSLIDNPDPRALGFLTLEDYYDFVNRPSFVFCGNTPEGDEAIELCNGLDDDCDGEIDENTVGAGRECTDYRGHTCQMPCVWECVEGTLQCLP